MANSQRLIKTNHVIIQVLGESNVVKGIDDTIKVKKAKVVEEKPKEEVRRTG